MDNDDDDDDDDDVIKYNHRYDNKNTYMCAVKTYQTAA